MTNSPNRVAAMLVALVLAAGACESHAPAARPRTPSVPRPQAPSPVPGPLDGLTWPAGKLEPGMLLHDDGTRLWNVPLRGKPRLLWTHPPADVYDLAADADGTRLAMVVQPYAGDGRPSADSILYLLEPGGSIKRVVTNHAYATIRTPVFVRAPTDPKGPVRLYWSWHSEGGFDAATDTPLMHLMTLGPSGPEPVLTPLRWGQAPYLLFAYPGGGTSAMIVFRRANMPSRFALVRNDDLLSGGDDSSPTVWGYWQDVADTDVQAGVAWLTPSSYVAAIGDDSGYPGFQLDLYRVGCEFKPPRVIYRGSELDTAYSESYWSLLALDPNHLLAIGREDAIRVVNAGRRGRDLQVPWRIVDVRTGSVSVTGAMWDRIGAWTVVRPSMPFIAHPEDLGCDEQ